MVVFTMDTSIIHLPCKTYSLNGSIDEQWRLHFYLLRPLGIDMIPLELEFDELKIDALEEVLEERVKSGKRMPKLMYVIPVGGNPTGFIITPKEKEELYNLACRYNFLIMEDDPYYFLRFSKENEPSFLSMDTENRVLRFDTFSKIFSAGLRVGFITGPTELVNQLNFRIQVSSMHPSTLSQLIIYRILEEWQFEGFMEHLNSVQTFYKNRRDIMVRAFQDHLIDLVDNIIPSAGFFLWVRLKYITDSKNFASKKCLDNLILVTPGYIFFTDEHKPCPYIRLSYSSMTEDEIHKVLPKLAALLREEITGCLEYKMVN